MSHHRPRKTFDSHFNPAKPGVVYGLLRGKVIKFGAEDGTPTPHFQIIIQDNNALVWRVAVNVRSDDGSNDQAVVVDPLNHPILDKLPAVSVGFTSLPNHQPGLALDFVRDPIFNPADLQTLPPFDSDEAGLEDVLTKLTQQAQDEANNGVELYVWGSKFEVGNRPVAADTLYHDTVGVHDVHMNQGNPPPHQADNGSYQDGGLVFHFTDRYVGVFMKFQSQVGLDDKGNVVIPGGEE
jgi:uncharacterized protein YukJ